MYSPKIPALVSLATGLLTLITFGIAIFTPPITGFFCQGDCIDYPYYNEIVSRFPRDYIWMFPAIGMMLLYIALYIGIHQQAPTEKRFFSLVAVALAIMAGSVLSVDYYLQIAVIQPSLLHGETEGIALLTQYNPHGIFIALEEFGYLVMCLSFLAIFPAIARNRKNGHLVQWILLLGFSAGILSTLIIAATHGNYRGYLLEVVILSIDWLVLILTGFLMFFYFRSLAAEV
jgi:hypothetical protein